MANPTSSNCGGPTMSPEEQEIRAENARLKEELARVCALAKKFLDRPLFDLTAMLPPMGDGVMETTPSSEMIQKKRSKLIDLSSTAMDELIKMVEPDFHLWVKSPESGKEKLNLD
ncbi:hypothetical protein P8452_55411 [Trifolium repens]|nr:homeobox-leucine zipper protein ANTHOCYANINLESS [Trifolium repens]WJX71414.1 hypothetical protein P8452_55411 [Trifolium repens]